VSEPVEVTNERGGGEMFEGADLTEVRECVTVSWLVRRSFPHLAIVTSP
jgi:hypothetical protein